METQHRSHSRNSVETRLARRGFLALGLAPAFVRAQTIQERGRQLVADAVRAMGGEKFLGMRDRIEEGRAYTYYRERLSGLGIARFETMYADLAEGIKVREKQIFGKKQDYYLLFTGDGKGWDVTFRGAREVPEDTVENWENGILRNALYILRCRVNEPGMIFERRGSEVFENQPVEIVDITDSENRTVSLYIHASTKLPVRAHSRRQSPKDRGWDEFDTRYGKYREVSGVMWPWAITRSRNGERNLELYSSEVLINTGLATSNFQIGPDTKIIPSKKK
jgi:hypothetical protein